MESQLRCIRTLAHKGSSPTFSLDGKTLVSFSSSDKTANVWNVNTGELKNSFTGLKEIIFSVDRKILAGRCGDNTIKLWDVETGELKHSLTGHSFEVISIAFSPDDKTLVSRDYNTIKFWNVLTGELKHSLNGHSSGVSFINFSPDGKTLVTRNHETIKIWDVETGELKHNLTEHSSKILAIAFSPDSKTLVTRDEETIKIWYACTGKLITTIAKCFSTDCCSGYIQNAEIPVFSPSGQYLAISSSEPREDKTFHKTTILWDMETGKEIQNLGNSCGAIAFSHDGKILFISCRERQEAEYSTPAGYDTYSYTVNYMRIWDLTTNQVKTSGSSHFYALSPDGQFVVTKQEYDDGMHPSSRSIGIIDIGTGKAVQSFPRGTAAKLSPDGKNIAVYEEGGLFKLINFHSGISIATLSGGVGNFTFSPDGNILAVGNSDAIKLWQETTEPILKQQLHGYAYPHLKRLEEFLASELWSDADLETADVIKHFPSQDLNVVDQLWVHYSNGRYGFSVQKQIWQNILKNPPGKGWSNPPLSDLCRFGLSVGWHTVKYHRNYHGEDDGYLADDWDTTRKGYYPRAVGIKIDILQKSKNDDSPALPLLKEGSKGKAIFLWNLVTGEPLHGEPGHSGYVNSVAIAPDGKTIVSGSWDNTIKVWDILTGKYLRTLSGHSDAVNSVAIAPDGKTIVSGSWDKTIVVWDFVTGEFLHTLAGHSGYVNSVAIAPDGKTIVSGSRDKAILVWDFVTGKYLRALGGHSDYVNSVAISPDGKTIVSGSRDKTIKVWDILTGKSLYTLAGHSGYVNSVAISPDGKTIVSGSWDNTIKVWDILTSECLDTLVGHSDYVNSVAIAPDGKTIVSGSLDKTIKVWDISTGEALRTFSGHLSDVRSVAIAPNGKTIVTGSGDKTFKVWGMDDPEV